MRSVDALQGDPADLAVTDGGLETDLIFHHGVDLPEFAAFPLVLTPEGRSLLSDYYAGYVAVARAAGTGLRLETPTWRANPDWGARLGYDHDALARVNRAAVELLRVLAEEQAADLPRVEVVGQLGPRGDGYRHRRVDPSEAADYHRPQLTASHDADADSAVVLTLTDVGEAIGVARAAAEVGLRLGVGFTVETDGRLPDGTPVAEAVEALDADTPPDHVVLNCAHPDHVLRGLTTPGRWRERVEGLRFNASTLSHAELDEATELDDGDPADLAAAARPVLDALPAVRVLGGCCGTDVRHVAALWGVEAPASLP